MPAIWAAVVVSVTLQYLIAGKTFSPREIVRFALLLDLSFDGVLWSLVYEIAVCIFYPLMLVFTRRLNLVLQLLVLVGLYWMQENRPIMVSYGAVTFAFPLFAFYLGLIVPTVGRALVQNLPKPVGLALFALSFALIAGQAWYKALLEFDPPIVHAYFGLAHQIDYWWTYYWELLAAFYIIAWIRFSENSVAERFLTARPMVAFIFFTYQSWSQFCVWSISRHFIRSRGLSWGPSSSFLQLYCSLARPIAGSNSLQSALDVPQLRS